MHVDYATSLLNMSLELHELGRDAEAEPLNARAVEIFEKLLGPDNTQVAMGLLDQTEALTALREYDRAHTAIERALAIWRERGAEPFFTGYGLLDLGRLQLAEGHPQAARATLERAAALLGKADEQVAAEAQFEIARAMWASPADRRQALSAARQARQAMGQGPDQARKRAAIDAWLRERQAS